MTIWSGVFCDDGLGEAATQRYAARRSALASAASGLILVPSVQLGVGYEYRFWFSSYAPLFQDPLFLYLTGINQAKLLLMIDADKPGHPATLYCEPKNPSHAFWEGFHFGTGDDAADSELKRITGIDHVRPFSELIQDLKERLVEDPELHLNFPWFETDDGIVFEDNLAEFKQTVSAELADLSPTILNVMPSCTAQRTRLDAHDQHLLKTACDKTGQVFQHVCKQLAVCDNESQVAAALDGKVLALSRYRNSFPSIVACGGNATTLHYNKNDDPLDPNALLLLDFGVRWYGLHADVSRTIPVNGRFNPLQALLYQIVLDTQLYVESLVKPGVTIAELNDACWTKMETLLEERFLSKGGQMQRDYDKQPHNVGHLLGHAVHDGDPCRLYRSIPLTTQQVITNEPGLYGHFNITLEGVAYGEAIGIRIEDDLMVTASGCENLTADCPKTIAALEAVLA